MSVTISAVLSGLSRAAALFGGLCLLLVMTLVVVSVTGRALSFLGLSPIPGDYELAQYGTALAVFCFLPWCQLRRGHVSVDIMASVLGFRRDAALATFYDLCMTAVSALILWRLWAGMVDKKTYFETSYILQIPVWMAYAVCVPFAALLVVVSAWTAYRSLRDAMTQSNAKPGQTGGIGR